MTGRWANWHEMSGSNCIASDTLCTIGTEGQTSQSIFYSNNSSTMSVFKGTPEYDVNPRLCDHTINGIVTIKDRI